MDLSDISDFQDVMTTTSHEDIPHLDDVFGLWIQTIIWINILLLELSEMNQLHAHQSQCIQQAKYLL